MIFAFILAYYPECISALEPLLGIFPDHNTEGLARKLFRIDTKLVGSDLYPAEAHAFERALETLRE